MANRSVLVVMTFAILVSGIAASPTFARSAGGAAGAAGGASGAAGSASGGGSGGNGGSNLSAVLYPVRPPHRAEVAVLQSHGCWARADDEGLTGWERLSFVRLCRFDAEATFDQ